MYKFTFLIILSISLLNCKQNANEYQSLRKKIEISQADKTKISKEIQSLKSIEEKNEYLSNLYQEDQKLRKGKDNEIIQNFGYASNKHSGFNIETMTADYLNYLKVQKFIEVHGFPNPKDYSRLAMGGITTVLLHQDFEIQKEIYPKVKEAYDNGYIKEVSFAFILNSMYVNKFGETFKIDGPFSAREEIGKLLTALNLE